MSFDPSNSPGVLMTANTTGTVSFNALGRNETVYNTSATLLTTATITLPTVTIPGQMLRYESKGAITSLTVNGTVDIGSPITAYVANTVLAYQATLVSGHFLRIQ